MFHRVSRFFSHFNSSPDPVRKQVLSINMFLRANLFGSEKLWEHRQRQYRAISQNPFEPLNVLPSVDELANLGPSASNTEKLLENEKTGEALRSAEHMDKEWGTRPPTWLSLVRETLSSKERNSEQEIAL